MTPDPGALLDLTVDVAHEAGRLVRDRRDAVDRITGSATKSTPTDVVTESDTAAEALIRRRLLSARPGDGLLGEEGATGTGGSGVAWVVDGAASAEEGTIHQGLQPRTRRLQQNCNDKDQSANNVGILEKIDGGHKPI